MLDIKWMVVRDRFSVFHACTTFIEENREILIASNLSREEAEEIAVVNNYKRFESEIRCNRPSPL